MAVKPSPKLARIGEHQVTCTFCSHDLFYDRPILLNTAGSAFFGVDWADKAAIGLICARCGYIMQFIGGNVFLADVPPPQGQMT